MSLTSPCEEKTCGGQRQCQFCFSGRVEIEEANYKKHLLVLHRDEVFKCRFCVKDHKVDCFADLDDVREHLRGAHNVENQTLLQKKIIFPERRYLMKFKCPSCQQVFMGFMEEDVRDHLKKHGPEYPKDFEVGCRGCLWTSRSQDKFFEFLSHSHHSDEKRLMVEKGNSRDKVPSQACNLLKRHLESIKKESYHYYEPKKRKTSINDEAYSRKSCEYQNYRESDKNRLEHGMKISVSPDCGEEEESSSCEDTVSANCFKCYFCNDFFSLKLEVVMQHVEGYHKLPRDKLMSGIVMPKDLKVYSCTECDHHCLTLAGMKSHQRRIHENWTYDNIVCICRVCRHEFETLSDLTAHCNQHFDNNQERIPDQEKSASETIEVIRSTVSSQTEKNLQEEAIEKEKRSSLSYDHLIVPYSDSDDSTSKIHEIKNKGEIYSERTDSDPSLNPSSQPPKKSINDDLFKQTFNINYPMIGQEEDSFECCYCFTTMDDKITLAVHVYHKHLEQSFKCKLCLDKYASLFNNCMALKEHVETAHFSKVKAFWDIEKKSLGVFPRDLRCLKCYHCYEEFYALGSDDMRKHHEKKHPHCDFDPSFLDYKCRICMKRGAFDDEKELQAHLDKETHKLPLSKDHTRWEGL